MPPLHRCAEWRSASGNDGLLDDDEAAVFLDDALEGLNLVAGNDEESRRVCSDVTVLRRSQLDGVDACFVRALANEAPAGLTIGMEIHLNGVVQLAEERCDAKEFGTGSGSGSGFRR